MSYVLHAWSEPKVSTLDQAITFVFDGPHEKKGQDPKLIEFAKALTTVYPDMENGPDEDDGDGSFDWLVWTDSPLDGKTDDPIYAFGVITKAIDETLFGFIAKTAAAHGLHVLDQQAAQLWLPDGTIVDRDGKRAPVRSMKDNHPLHHLVVDAEKGGLAAQLALGQRYGNGIGVPQDYAEAAKWYTLAAQQGSAEAQNDLGLQYKNGQGVAKDAVTGAQWMRRAADQGSSAAQFNLASMHKDGVGVPQNYEWAAKWFDLAVKQGNAGAMNQLGFLYLNGLGVPLDYLEAVRLFRLASDKGNGNATYNLGVMHHNGYGVQKSRVAAYALYRLAVDRDPIVKEFIDRKPVEGLTYEEVQVGRNVATEMAKHGNLLKSLDACVANHPDEAEVESPQDQEEVAGIRLGRNAIICSLIFYAALPFFRGGQTVPIAVALLFAGCLAGVLGLWKVTAGNQRGRDWYLLALCIPFLNLIALLYLLTVAQGKLSKSK